MSTYTKRAYNLETTTATRSLETSGETLGWLNKIASMDTVWLRLSMQAQKVALPAPHTEAQIGWNIKAL
jgi:hypothetical protein